MWNLLPALILLMVQGTFDPDSSQSRAELARLFNSPAVRLVLTDRQTSRADVSEMEAEARDIEVVSTSRTVSAEQLFEFQVQIATGSLTARSARDGPSIA